MNDAKFIKIEAHENYQKRSFRNRCILCGPNGLVSLSIPLTKGKNQQLKIKEVIISYDTPWHITFLKTIKSNYGKAPYFDEVYDDLHPIIMAKESNLFNLNDKLLKWVIEFLQLEIAIEYTEEYRMKDVSAISPSSFQEKIIPRYDQLFSDRYPFQNNLSILDLLFCKGPEGLIYLNNAKIMTS